MARLPEPQSARYQRRTVYDEQQHAMGGLKIPGNNREDDAVTQALRNDPSDRICPDSPNRRPFFLVGPRDPTLLMLFRSQFSNLLCSPSGFSTLFQQGFRIHANIAEAVPGSIMS